MYFSIIIPVYNRPDELRDLLQSLVKQQSCDFEVIVVEDGSTNLSKEITESFSSQLLLKYFYISNVGQGFARNYGMERASGRYFVLFDSDCIIPSQYLTVLKSAIENRKLDAHGGPDAADGDFSSFQKAINYSMTSVLTTGGIRGKLKNPENFQARGFNMGLSAAAFEKTGGFIDPNKGEDIELSIRIKKAGLKLELVTGAFVYHKRKNNWVSFFKQSFNFGRNRINVSRYHPRAVKPVHILPSVFFLFCLGILLASVFQSEMLNLPLTLLGIWLLAVFFHSSWENKSIWVGFLAVFTSFGQLNSYGAGLIYEFVQKLIKG